MRPPQNAGENGEYQSIDAGALAASMRPPQNAGENGGWVKSASGDVNCFNEAPAECGGKHHRDTLWRGFALCASMRPPQNAGENGLLIVRQRDVQGELQ